MRLTPAVGGAEPAAKEGAQRADGAEGFTLRARRKVYGLHRGVPAARYVIDVPESVLPLFHMARKPFLQASFRRADVKVNTLFHEDGLFAHPNAGRACLLDDEYVRREHVQS